MLKLRDVGELGFLKLISKYVNDLGFLKFGDDASDLRVDGKSIVVTVDSLSEGSDKLPGMSYQQFGWKCAVYSLSDLAAKGAKPLALLLSLSAPSSLEVGDAESIVKGFSSACQSFNSLYIGGDLGEAPEVVVTSVGLGVAEHSIIPRSGARPGDLVAVTGYFGWTGLAFKILLEGFPVKDEQLKRLALRSAYTPKPRVNLGIALAKSGVASASIDSSDGLAKSLHELSRMSGVGFEITELPAPPRLKRYAEEHGLELFDLVLYGGEEFELVVTVRQGMWPQACRVAKAAGGRLLRIGKVVEENKVYYRSKEEERVIPPLGWSHFER